MRAWRTGDFRSRRSAFQLGYFQQSEVAPISRRHVEREGPVLHAPDFLHVVPHFFKHFTDLAVAAFNDGHFEPRIIAFADQANFCRSGAHAAAAFFGDGNSAAQLVELGLVGLAGDFDNVNLRHVGSRFHQSIGQGAVVRHQ